VTASFSPVLVIIAEAYLRVLVGSIVAEMDLAAILKPTWLEAVIATTPPSRASWTTWTTSATRRRRAGRSDGRAGRNPQSAERRGVDGRDSAGGSREAGQAKLGG
jgi:hypothetical protein